MKKSHKLIPSLLLPALILLGFSASCNKKTEGGEDIIVVTPGTSAVTKFSLKSDSKVMSNLDSVFFSIDLNKGVIFNADSLPKGTKVSRLIPVITFANTMSAAELVYSDSTGKTISVNYLENQNDSVDFTHDVMLNVTAADGTNKYSYRIKVNVHKEVPDSMMWDKIAYSKLPSRLPDPVAQKTVMSGTSVHTVIEESDHTYTLATSGNLDEGYDDIRSYALPFVPRLETLSVSGNAFWMLDAAGMLHTSADMQSWTATGEEWVDIVGPYLDVVLGIKSTDNGLMHCHYPASEAITDCAVSADFPMKGRSSLAELTNRWTPDATVFFVGGEKQDGTKSGETWAFDGSVWTTISAVPVPAMSGTTLVRYVMYRNPGNDFSHPAFDAWLLIGGQLADGSYSRSMYYSFDNGVTWNKAPLLMQLPDWFPTLVGADGVVMNSELKGDLSEIWTPTPAFNVAHRLKLSHAVDDGVVTWECPYIYIIGGETPDGSLSDDIWRGAFVRLTSIPLI